MNRWRIYDGLAKSLAHPDTSSLLTPRATRFLLLERAIG